MPLAPWAWRRSPDRHASKHGSGVVRGQSSVHSRRVFLFHDNNSKYAHLHVTSMRHCSCPLAARRTPPGLHWATLRLLSAEQRSSANAIPLTSPLSHLSPLCFGRAPHPCPRLVSPVPARSTRLLMWPSHPGCPPPLPHPNPSPRRLACARVLPWPLGTAQRRRGTPSQAGGEGGGASTTASYTRTVPALSPPPSWLMPLNETRVPLALSETA